MVWGVSLFLNRQVWAIATLVGIVWIMIVGPSFFERMVNIDEWQMKSCDFRGVHVFVSAPRSIAPGDQRYFEITVENETATSLHNVRISVKSLNGLLLFDESNTVTVEKLEENEVLTKVLYFRVANLTALEEIPTVVVYSSEGESSQPEVQSCSEAPILVNNAWRRMVVQLKSVPDVWDAGATYIGYLGTLVTGLLALTGKIGPVVRGIISVLKSSALQANGQPNTQNQQGDIASTVD